MSNYNLFGMELESEKVYYLMSGLDPYSLEWCNLAEGFIEIVREIEKIKQPTKIGKE